jgi:hypothetical protein
MVDAMSSDQGARAKECGCAKHLGSQSLSVGLATVVLSSEEQMTMVI